MNKSYSPLAINVYRGPNIESTHRVSAVVVGVNKRPELIFGDQDLLLYPRSSIKPIQAIPILQSGAFERFNITDEELAIACASHSSEAKHVQLVENWLARMGFSAADLECGAHMPINQDAAIEIARQGRSFSAINNNCSGKHTGMLAVAKALSVDPKGYVKPNHPVQLKIRGLIEEFCEVRFADSDEAIDGCSIPTHLMPLKNLAIGMAQIAQHSLGEKIFKAVVQNPFLIAGSQRYCTMMIEYLQGRALIKTGAEGVMVATIPELKMGIAAKCHDGSTRAAELAMSQVLYRLGIIKDKNVDFLSPSIKNWNQIEVGRLTCADF